MNEIEKILNTNEKIIWEGKPQTGPFIFSYILFIPCGIIFGLIPLSMIASTLPEENLPENFYIVPVGSLIVGILMALNPIYQYILSRKTFYAITDKRVIIQKGIIGTDFETVDYDQIKSMEVNVGIVDKIFGGNSGTISFDTGKVGTTSKGETYSMPHLLQAVSEPYAVFEKLKKVSHDVKTDIEYPNDLRPETNPGYGTKYNPK